MTDITSTQPGVITDVLSVAERAQKRRHFRQQQILAKLINPRWVFWATFKYLTLFAATLAVLVPPFVILVASFKTPGEYFDTNKMSLPESFSYIENYITVFNEGDLGLAFINTFIILGVSLVLSMLIGSMISYALSRFEFKARKLILLCFMLAMVIPGVTTQVATFEVIKNLGLINNKLSVILLYIGTDVIMIYVFLQFMKGIPVELDEAAKIEGASYFTIFRRIIFPLLKPAIATMVILKTISIYNDFYFPMLYLPKDDQVTVSTALYKFTTVFGTEWTTISAGIIIILIPSLLLFLALQKHIYAGVTHGAVKG